MISKPRAVNRPTLIACLSLFLLAGLGLMTGPKIVKTQAAPPVQVESSIGQWSAPIAMPAIPIHTHVLPNGKVLFWGRDKISPTSGTDVDNMTQTYVWNPATPTTAPVAISNGTTNLFCSGHAFLTDGRLLVAGGHDKVDNEGERHTNIFNFATNSWSLGPAMNQGRWYPTSTALANGEVLTVSGNYWDGVTVNPDGSHVIKNNDLPQVRQTTGELRDLTTARSQMNAAGRSLVLYPWMFLAPDGRVFNAGPDKVKGFFSTAGAGAWADAGRGLDSLYAYRDAGSAVMYEPGKILIVGGGGPPTSTAETIDLNGAGGWQWTGSMQNARRHMNATILADGKVLVTGGTSVGNGMDVGFNDATGSVLPAEMWDPATGTWTTMASMAVRRLYHSTAVLLPDGRVLSAGGGGPASSTAGDTDHKDAEIYSPPYLFRGARPTITSAPTSVNYGETFFVGTPDAAAGMKASLVRLSSVTHSFNENQRFLWPTTALVAGGLNVTVPTSRNALPPGHYMLFILNGSGVPSVAKIISVQDYEGYHEVADCGQISGWAWNKNEPNAPVSVDIFAGNTYLATVSANLFRQDLLNAGKGNGSHAFVYNVPASLRNGQLQNISVRFAGGYSNLTWSPRSMICGASLFPSPSGTITSASGGGSTWEQATQFSATMNGKITHIRFYKVPEETGSHVGRIWSDTGTPLASQPFTNETPSGWQEVQLGTPVQVTAGVRYRVSYNVNSFGAKIVSGLGSPITNGPLTAHGAMYSTPSGSFPNTGSVSNFLADIRFSAP